MRAILIALMLMMGGVAMAKNGLLAEAAMADDHKAAFERFIKTPAGQEMLHQYKDRKALERDYIAFRKQADVPDSGGEVPQTPQPAEQLPPPVYGSLPVSVPGMTPGDYKVP